VKKLVKVFKSLQTIKSLTRNFVDGSFRSYIRFPYLKLEKNRKWYLEMAVCQNFYSYP